MDLVLKFAMVVVACSAAAIFATISLLFVVAVVSIIKDTL